MADNAYSEENLKKLNVAQLKAICKEKGVMGYSKVVKAVIIEKLMAKLNGAPVVALGMAVADKDVVVVRGDQKKKEAPAVAPEEKPKPSKSKKVKPTIPALTNAPPATVAKPTYSAIPITPALSIAPAPAATTTPIPSNSHSSLAPSPPQSLPWDVSAANAPSVPAKRNSQEYPELPSKKAKTVPPTKPAPSKAVVNPAKTLIPQKRLEAPRIPLAQLDAAAVPQKTENIQSIKALGKRFTPLVPSKKPAAFITTPAPRKDLSITPTALVNLEFTLTPSRPIPLCPQLTLPPPLSKRKHVKKFALVLSGVTDPTDLRNCALVSKMFRYAIHISAQNRLSQYFPGRRSTIAMQDYKLPTTDMWPYLRWREEEVRTRRETFEKSFLGLYLNKKGLGIPISEKLWASLDDERQVVIAIRFILTRLYVSTSLTSDQTWHQTTITDIQEIIKGEIWRIDMSHRNGRKESVYALEETCEVIGGADPDTMDTTDIPNRIRADWETHIQNRVSDKRIWDYLSWPNAEEYEGGISKLWLKRIGTDKDGTYLKKLAKRYILASLVSNSVSGQKKSAMEMAQDFAGLPEMMKPSATQNLKISLFLPTTHLVESVHLATSKGVALHPAVAIVQTPSREYFVLRDNGMQIGCSDADEEGVARVWMDVVGCDGRGVPAW